MAGAACQDAFWGGRRQRTDVAYCLNRHGAQSFAVVASPGQGTSAITSVAPRQTLQAGIHAL